MRTKLEITADGSHTLFVPDLDEHYHSVNGAVQESLHVFIEAGLLHCTSQELQVLEVGFGTGLNAYLSLLNGIQSGRTIHYTAIEAYPVPIDVITQLNFAQEENQQILFERLHTSRWGTKEKIIEQFYLHKIESDFTQFDFSSISNIDLIYFDAFAPDKQSDMWTQDIFDALYKLCNPGAILVTYCAKGVVRRMMQSAGFVVERLPGPPGKREMLRARKPC